MLLFLSLVTWVLREFLYYPFDNIVDVHGWGGVVVAGWGGGVVCGGDWR
jgi:hypothetical protein